MACLLFSSVPGPGHYSLVARDASVLLRLLLAVLLSPPRYVQNNTGSSSESSAAFIPYACLWTSVKWKTAMSVPNCYYVLGLIITPQQQEHLQPQHSQQLTVTAIAPTLTHPKSLFPFSMAYLRRGGRQFCCSYKWIATHSSWLKCFVHCGP